MKRLFSLFSFMILIAVAAKAQQRVGINITAPAENLHVDSTIKVGKNLTLGTSGRKNLIKFGDGDYVTIGEEQADDRLYIRYGDLIFFRAASAAGTGRIGVKTETPSADFHVNGTFRLEGNGAAAGTVLTSDASGNATWQAPKGPGVGFRAALTSTVSIPAGYYSLVNFDEDYDDNFAFNAVTGIFTAPSAGVYHFTANIAWTNIPANTPIVYNSRLVVESPGGGVDYIAQVGQPLTGVSGYGNQQLISGDYKLAVGDKVHVEVSHSYGSNLTLNTNGSSSTRVMGYKVY